MNARGASRALRKTVPLLVALLAAACSATTPAGTSPSAGAATVVAPTAATPAVATAAPSSPAAPSASASAVDPVLAAALAYASDQASTVALTNWTRLLASGGPVGSAADRRAVLGDLAKTRAFPSAFAATSARMRDAWGFDSLDLAWEATYSSESGVGSVLQFADGFDLSLIVALLGQRGFHRTSRGDVTIYTHAADPSLDWLRGAPLMMLNVAVVPASHRLVAASSPQMIETLVAAGASGSPAAGSAVARGLALAAALGAPYGAWFALDPGYCRTLATAAALASAAPNVSAIHPTEATGLAFDLEPAAAPVQVAMLYADAATAATDLPGRTALQGADSLVTKAPFGTSVMALSGGRVAGPVLLFDGAPRGGLAAVALRAVLERDLPFAACR